MANYSGSKPKYKVVLREDGWFDTGKDDKGIAGVLYHSKQALKRDLRKIGPASLPHLEGRLGEVSAPSGFEGRVRLEGRNIVIPTEASMPGYCVLGKVKKINRPNYR